MRFAIHLHEAADVAGHADVLRRGVQMGWEITGVGRVAENAIAVLVRGMLDGVSGHCVAGKAELIAWRGKSDVGGAFHVGDRMAGGAAAGDSGVDVLPCGLVVVTRKTLGGIYIGREKDGMLVKVGPSRRSEKQQDDSSQSAERKTKQWREWESGGVHHLSRAKILFADPLHSCTSSLSSMQRAIAVRSGG